METIKISVEVSVNLSENTQNFIKSLFGNAIAPSASAAPAAKSAPSAPATPAKPAPAKPTTQPAAPAQTQSAAKPAPSAPAAPAASSASKNIEDVRSMLAEKVNEHRDEIKQKLNELGAPSVTKLDPAKYDEMYNFLESL
jgi:cell division septation protein DedD